MKLPTILLVEDDANDEELTRLALNEQQLKHELVVVRDGVEALDYLFKRGKFADRPGLNPQLMLLDLKLPKLNGLEVLKQLREASTTHHVPVVVFTSSREEKDIKECYQRGANAFVRKPIEFSEFSDAVRTMASFWLALNNLTEDPA